MASQVSGRFISRYLHSEQGKEKEADAARKELSEGSKSDHIVLINAMKVGSKMCSHQCYEGRQQDVFSSML